MSLVKQLYFSPLGYIIIACQRLVSPFVHKMMLYGYYNRIQHKLFRGTRVSTSAYITNPDKLDIGDNVWINHNVRIDASGGVKIGEGCQIGYASMILSHSSHMAIRLNGSEFVKQDIDNRVGYIHKSVEIGEYTFVGGGSAIMPGVKIGKGCVIGVNSVVTKDIPNFSIVVGSPAKIIGNTIDTDKQYFSNPIVQRNYYNRDILQCIQKDVLCEEDVIKRTPISS